jgi:hypothetical protein
VTYPKPGFLEAIDHFLILGLQAPQRLACRGSQTPYPQKRQQTLGATLPRLWKTPETRWESTFPKDIMCLNLDLLIF